MFKRWRKERLLRKMSFHNGAMEVFHNNRLEEKHRVNLSCEIIKLEVYHSSRLELITHLLEGMENH